MRIGINTRFLLSSKMEGFGWYTYEVVKRLVEQHPEHEFVFFFDRPYDKKFIFAPNVTPVVISPPTRLVTLIILWFEWALPRALKKHKIDLFFSPDGFLSLKSACKQVGVIHDLNFKHHPHDLPWRFNKFYNYFFPKYAQKAHHILTVSEYSKQDIVTSYGILENKITVAWNGASSVFKPLTDQEKKTVRNDYSQGEKYFLFVGAIHPRKNLKTLIQAFTRYKEQGKSGKLVIVGTDLFRRNFSNHFSISEEVQNEIIFTGHLPLNELAKVMGGATALIFVPYFEGFGIPLVEAMRCGTPIIAGNLTSLPEVVGDAGIIVSPFDVEEIAHQMNILYTDENLQQELRQKGLERSPLFDWDFTAEKVWNVLEKSLEK